MRRSIHVRLAAGGAPILMRRAPQLNFKEKIEAL
jgi:hypothetical protein